MVERRSWIPMEDGVRLAVSLFLPESGAPELAELAKDVAPERVLDRIDGYDRAFSRFRPA